MRRESHVRFCEGAGVKLPCATRRNIYVRSERAGERVLAGMKRFLSRRLKLKVNEQKSAVGRPRERTFLGFSFTREGAKRKISPRSVTRLKTRVRAMTRRGGRSLAQVLAELIPYLRGWAGYYGHTELPHQLEDLAGWIRRRLRCYVWKQWKRPRRRYRHLLDHGVSCHYAWRVVNTLGPWRASRSQALTSILSNAYFHRLGIPPWDSRAPA